MDANQNRREFKFVLKPELSDVVRGKVAENLAVDIHSNDGYPVLSEYFDSSELTTYWQRQLGIPNRRRLRGRLYGRSDGSIPPSAFIEIKHKLEGTTVKRRVNCDVDDLSDLSSGSLPEDLGSHSSTGDRLIAELDDLIRTQGNRPIVQIRYQRFAYDSGVDGTIRITFDLDLRCRFQMKPMRPDCDDFDLPLLETGFSIMEVKTIGAVPFWFRNLVGEFHLIPQSFSKYGAALELYKLNNNTTTTPSQYR